MKQFVVTSLKVLLGLVVSLGAALYVVVNYSTTKKELTCQGHWQRGTERQPEVAYVVLTEYRWWVHLWAESDGDVHVQTAKLAMANYIPFVDKIGEDSLALFIFKHDRSGKTVGGYRAANGDITIKFLDDLVFVGACRRQ
jgi:hypothetical protein